MWYTRGMLHDIPIVDRFSENINWNGFSYIISKVLATGLSFVLYKLLSTSDFSIWANTQSIIFLLLLWLDCGFRKSIPRFIPELSEKKQSYTWFIRNTIVFHTAVIILALPIFHFTISSLIKSLSAQSHIPSNSYLYYLPFVACSVFFIEGVVSIFKIFFHAHFWSKWFNGIDTIMVIGEKSLNCFFIYTISDSYKLITALFLSKLISRTVLLILSTWQLYWETKKINSMNHGLSDTFFIDRRAITKRFITHSTIMWINNTIKSLSERNFLLPLLTYTLGPSQANIYKVANDGAILLYRSVFKTIGSTDTALLSHIKTEKDQGAMRNLFFEKISKTIIFLCSVSLTIGACASRFALSHAIKPSALNIFYLLLVSQIFEIILSPYERILEVDCRYRQLFYAYAPYIIVMATILTTPFTHYLGLNKTLTLICIARLTTSLIMTFYANLTPNNSFRFPFSYAFNALAAFIAFNSVAHFAIPVCIKYIKII